MKTSRPQIPAPVGTAVPGQPERARTVLIIHVALYPCGDPVCGHSDVAHEIKRDGTRGKCSHHEGPKCTPCGCTRYQPLPKETPHA